MNGAESLVKTLLASGVDTCFANPGTSEMHFVAALDAHPDMRCVLCLFEGGTSGAADGYFRMTGRPAATMLHLAPGFGNALSNLHNARKGGSGVVNIMGDHATYHLAYESPLKGDTLGVASTVSHWSRSAADARDVARDGAAAVRAARSQNGQIATLILPANTAWEEGTAPITADPPPPLRRASDDEIDAAAQMLTRPGAALLVGGVACYGEMREVAGQIAAHTGARLMLPLHTGRRAQGAGNVAAEQVQYPIDVNQALFAEVEQLVCCGTQAPVNFFAYPGKPSVPTPPGCNIFGLCTAQMDVGDALTRLSARLEAGGATAPRVPLELPQMPEGRLDADKVGRVLANLMPEGAIICNEAITAGQGIAPHLARARAHDVLPTTGGAIGQCLPSATGAAIACPDRQVIALSGDGSAMYTLQSLWTMARERLNVVTLIFANRGYQILRGELARLGVDQVGRNAQRMFDVDDPELNWVALAQGHGVAGARAETCAALEAALADAFARSGPTLIEVVI